MEFHLYNLVLVLVAAWICGALANRFGYPSILGEIAAGVIFGPPLLDVLHTSHGLELLAEIGVFLLLLYIGMEINYKELLRVNKWGHFSALSGFLVPMAGGFILLKVLGYPSTAGLILGSALGITSLTVLSRILVDLKMLGTRLSNVMISSSLIADTLGLLVFGTILGIAGKGTVDLASIALTVGKAILFFGVTIYLGMRVFPYLGAFLKKTGFNERKANFTLVILIGFLFAALAETAGLHSILGAFLAGLFLRGEVLMRKLSHEVTGMVHDLSLGFLAPIFFVMAGFDVDLSALVTHWPMLLAVIALAGFAKLIGSTFVYIFSGAGWRESIVLGVGMNIHGAVEIIIAKIAFTEELITKDIFSIIVFTAICTTAITPLLLKRGVAMLKKKGLLSRSDEDREGMIIAGAQPLARLIAAEFQKTEATWLIDRNANSCKSAKAEGLTVIQGDALDEDTLDIAGAGNARVFLAMTPSEQVNAQARKEAIDFFGIPEVYTILPLEDKSGNELEGSTLFRPYVDVNEWTQRIAQKEYERSQYPIEEEVETSQLLMQLSNNGMLPLVVLRNNKAFIPAGLAKVQVGDEMVVLRGTQAEDKQTHVIEELIRKAPILDIEGPILAGELFKQAAEILSERVNLSPKKIHQLMEKREKESSTVIVPGLAIPHIVVPGTNITELLIARCKDEVTFYDEEHKARIVFVIAGSKDQRNLHLRILSAIAQLFQDPAFEDSVLSVENAERLREVILSTERRRF